MAALNNKYLNNTDCGRVIPTYQSPSLEGDVGDGDWEAGITLQHYVMFKYLFSPREEWLT